MATAASASDCAWIKVASGKRSRRRTTWEAGTCQNATGQTVKMRTLVTLSKIMEMADTTLDTDVEKTTKDALSKHYHVIILNDDEHTFDYVIEMLQAVFNLPYATAFACTVEADATGSSIVFTTSLEE